MASIRVMMVMQQGLNQFNDGNCPAAHCAASTSVMMVMCRIRALTGVMMVMFQIRASTDVMTVTCRIRGSTGVMTVITLLLIVQLFNS